MKVQYAPTKLALSDELVVLEQAKECSNTVATVDQAVDVPKTPQQAKKQSTTVIFGSTFLTIFLAEFGDKTQLSTLLMSAESQSPGIVFLGAGVALITTSLIGVLLGQWLAKRVAPKTLETAAGVSLLLVSAMLFWDVVQF